jgi:hypothetical protein
MDNSLDNSPGPRSKFQQSRSQNTGSGLLMLFGCQLLVLLEGVGVKSARSAALGPRTFDELAEAVADNLVLYSALLRDWT